MSFIPRISVLAAEGDGIEQIDFYLDCFSASLFYFSIMSFCLKVVKFSNSVWFKSMN